jgi:hypothetical protein
MNDELDFFIKTTDLILKTPHLSGFKKFWLERLSKFLINLKTHS